MKNLSIIRPSYYSFEEYLDSKLSHLNDSLINLLLGFYLVIGILVMRDTGLQSSIHELLFFYRLHVNNSMRIFLPILRRNQHRLALKNHEALSSASVDLNAAASITKTILSSAKHQNLFIKSTSKHSNRLNTAHKFTVAEIIIDFNSKDVAFSIQKVLKNHRSAAISLALSIATKGEIQFMPSTVALNPDESLRMWLLVQLAKPLILFEEVMPKILKLLNQVDLNSNFWANSFSFQLAIKHALRFSKLNSVEYQAFSMEIFSILSHYPQNRVAAELKTIVNDFKVTALNHGTIGDNQTRIQEFVPFLKNLINNEYFVTEHFKVDQSIQFLSAVEKETVSIISMVRKLLDLGYIPSGKTIETLVSRYVNEQIPNCYSLCRELYSYISKDDLSNTLFILLIRSIQTCTEKSNSGHLGIEEIEKEILRYI